MLAFVLGLLVVAWASRSGRLHAIGYVRPDRWARDVALGILLGVGLKLILKILIMPLLGADPVNHPYHYLAGDGGAIPGMVLVIVFGAGFGEETVFRGFAFDRLEKLFGSGIQAKALTVLVTTVLFALAHYHDQGVDGAKQAAMVGLVFGSIFAATGELWLVICGHVAFDLTAVAIIYWNLEVPLTRLVFR